MIFCDGNNPLQLTKTLNIIIIIIIIIFSLFF